HAALRTGHLPVDRPHGPALGGALERREWLDAVDIWPNQSFAGPPSFPRTTYVIRRIRALVLPLYPWLHPAPTPATPRNGALCRHRFALRGLSHAIPVDSLRRPVRSGLRRPVTVRFRIGKLQPGQPRRLHAADRRRGPAIADGQRFVCTGVGLRGTCRRKVLFVWRSAVQNLPLLRERCVLLVV